MSRGCRSFRAHVVQVQASLSKNQEPGRVRERISMLVASHPVTSFLVLTLVISWTCVFYFASGQAGMLGHEPSFLWMVFVAQFGPAYAALILVGIRDGRRGVANLLWGIRKVRIGWGPGMVILLHFVGVLGLAVILHLLLGGESLPLTDIEWGRVFAVLVGGAVIGMLFGGLSEEPGWRAYLLPRLQKRFSPLLASIVIGTIWGLWHLEPRFVAEGLQGGWSEFLSRWLSYQSVMVPSTIALSLMMTAIYNQTRGSLFAVMLLHSVHNAFMSATGEAWGPQLDPARDPANWEIRILLVASLWVVAVGVWWWYGKRDPVVVDEHRHLPHQHQLSRPGAKAGVSGT